MSLQVTVSAALAPSLVARARASAAAWGLPYFERAKKTGLPEGAFLVLGADGWSLRAEGHGTLRFSEGLARVRIKRLAAGFMDDTLVKVAELESGHRVLDCTFGLGADALVCAHVVGAGGLVEAVEQSLPLWVLGAEGVKALGVPITLVHGDCTEHLKSLPPQSFDCVLFDPMFSKKKKASPAFELLRTWAVHAPLNPEAIALARRVARRWVVVKGARYARDLERLGLKPLPLSRHADVVWGRVPGGA